MRYYHKIETLFERDTGGTKKLITGLWRNEAVSLLKDICWDWTEKIDGTNIVVCWDGNAVSFGGRTERASIPADLVNKLNEYFSGEENAQIFEQLFGAREVTLFGEGYGKKIQAAGASYIPDGVDFILFDVMIGNGFMSRDSVNSVARAFGLKSVPVVGSGTLAEAVKYIRSKPQSTIGTCAMEGIVVRPHVELCDRYGNRIIAKIKCRDFE